MQHSAVIKNQTGVSTLSAVIILPILITIMMVLFDLSRIYLATVFAKEVVLTTAKIAISSSPHSSVPDPLEIIKPTDGDTAVSQRERFWLNQVDAVASTYHGLPYFTQKELKVFNIGYGFMMDLNPDVAFPIPEPIQSKADLGGAINCSIYFEFVNLGDPSETLLNRDRVYYCRCVIPFMGLSLFQPLTGVQYYTITQSAYAYRSGDIVL